MKKILALIITAGLLFPNTAYAASLYSQNISNAKISVSQNTSETQEEQPILVYDNKNVDVMPLNFRKTTDLSILKGNPDLNLAGLDTLNISGSQQFSSSNFSMILKNVSTNLPFIDFDLRAESHGFINYYPVSYKGSIHNDLNKGLSPKQIEKKQETLLNSIILNSDREIQSFGNKIEQLTPVCVQDEKEIVTKSKEEYRRIFAIDQTLPSLENIDAFLDIIKDIKNDSWIHFHCKEGIGRTTTFMIFYDMLKNYDKATSSEITARQLALADFKEGTRNYSLLTSERRINLYNAFYGYCKDNKGSIKKSFSRYVKKNGIVLDLGPEYQEITTHQNN